jgi:hypothetical protein
MLQGLQVQLPQLKCRFRFPPTVPYRTINEQPDPEPILYGTGRARCSTYTVRLSSVNSTTGETRVKINQLADFLQAKPRFPARSFSRVFCRNINRLFLHLPVRLHLFILNAVSREGRYRTWLLHLLMSLSVLWARVMMVKGPASRFWLGNRSFICFLKHT